MGCISSIILKLTWYPDKCDDIELSTKMQKNNDIRVQINKYLILYQLN